MKIDKNLVEIEVKDVYQVAGVRLGILNSFFS